MWLDVFNFMGILSITKLNKREMKVSSVYAFLNGVKILGLIIFKMKIFHQYNSNSLEIISHLSYSRFFEQFIIFHTNIPYFYGIIILSLQLISSKKNSGLLTEVLNFRSKSVKLILNKTNAFYKFPKRSMVNLLILLFLTALCFIVDFFTTMQSTLKSGLAYIIYCSPYFVIIAFICYFYVLISFIVHSQNTFNFLIIDVIKKPNCPSYDIKNRIDDILKLHTSLHTIKEQVATTLKWQIVSVFFYFITEIVYQVKLYKINMRLLS